MFLDCLFNTKNNKKNLPQIREANAVRLGTFECVNCDYIWHWKEV